MAHNENRRRAIQRMLQVGTSIAGITAAGGAKSLGQISPSQRAFGVVYTKLTIPVIVRGRRSAFWQTVLSAARKAGQDLCVDIVELGTDSESDAEGQSTYRHRVESFGDRHRTCAF